MHAGTQPAYRGVTRSRAAEQQDVCDDRRGCGSGADEKDEQLPPHAASSLAIVIAPIGQESHAS
jgi:hypothetical protein